LIEKQLKILPACGANPNGTHLHLAAFSDNSALIRLLIERGVNLHDGRGLIGWKCEMKIEKYLQGMSFQDR